MSEVVVYATNYCVYCRLAEALLNDKGIAYRRVDVTRDRATRRWLVEATGRTTVPQIFIGEHPIGGYDALSALDRSGRLDQLVSAA
jgi:glutaredoxin 3